ncbi:MAG TPA: efflux RND transporter periplasmic adaptor subunit [Verrucomicrobiae bacterium]
MRLIVTTPRIFTLSLALALAWFSVSCSKSETADAAGKAGANRAVPVIVAKSTQRNVPVEIQAVGNVEPFSLVTVRPQITGRIQDVHFEEGQNVKAGDPLITLDPGPWQAELNQAQANLKRDEAQLFNARLEFQRSSNLFNSQIASEQDYQSAEADFRSAESTVLADAAAVTNAMVNLSYTQIVAPIDGRTGQIEVKAGNVVKSPDDALVTITQIRPAYVAFAVPEQYLSAIRHRASESELPVRAFAPGEQDEAAEGKLTFIDNRVNTDTGTILLKATFANTNLVLWPGQFVQAVLTLNQLTNATVVPAHAVQTGQDGEFIFVVKPDETVDARPVKAGLTYEGVRVIESGIQPGETVVTEGQLRLTPGVKVTTKTADETKTNSVSAQP